MRSEKGFTIIEIVTVLVIVGILLVIFLPNLNSQTTNSQVRTVDGDMTTLKSNIQEHYIDHPTEVLNVERLRDSLGLDVELHEGGTFGPAGTAGFFELGKEDPWGNPYYLIVGTEEEQYVIIHSYGPDGESSINSGGITNEVGDDILVLFYPEL